MCFRQLLVEFLEDFRSKFTNVKEAIPVIDKCQAMIDRVTEETEKHRIPLAIKAACQKSADSSLPCGLDWQLSQMHTALDKGCPVDTKSPEKEKEWMENRTKEQTALVEWLELFKRYIFFTSPCPVALFSTDQKRVRIWNVD